jgi:hypothetical protein
MAVLGDVFDSLRFMSLLQLLFAFFACIGYACAQGRLFGPRGRRNAGAVAGIGAIGFVLESREWMQGAMLIAFAIAGMGVFIAMVWLTSRLLGMARARRQSALDEALPEAAVPAGGARALPPRAGSHAHSTL